MKAAARRARAPRGACASPRASARARRSRRARDRRSARENEPCAMRSAAARRRARRRASGSAARAPASERDGEGEHAARSRAGARPPRPAAGRRAAAPRRAATPSVALARGEEERQHGRAPARELLRRPRCCGGRLARLLDDRLGVLRAVSGRPSRRRSASTKPSSLKSVARRRRACPRSVCMSAPSRPCAERAERAPRGCSPARSRAASRSRDCSRLCCSDGRTSAASTTRANSAEAAATTVSRMRRRPGRCSARADHGPKRYPTPRTVRISNGADGSRSSFSRRCRMCTSIVRCSR